MRKSRVLNLVSVALLVFFAAGCALFGSKPVSETRWFYNHTMQIELKGEETVAIMNNAVNHYKEVFFDGKDVPNADKAFYEIYVRADSNKDHVILPEEARRFWESYRSQFDARIGTGSIKFP